MSFQRGGSKSKSSRSNSPQLGAAGGPGGSPLGRRSPAKSTAGLRHQLSPRLNAASNKTMGSTRSLTEKDLAEKGK